MGKVLKLIWQAREDNQGLGGPSRLPPNFGDRRMKRYRRPKVIEGQIKVQRGNVEGGTDMCIFYGDDVPRCDRALVMNTLFSERLDWKKEVHPSFIDELQRRGYDLETLRFSIERKAP